MSAAVAKRSEAQTSAASVMVDTVVRPPLASQLRAIQGE